MSLDSIRTGVPITVVGADPKGKDKCDPTHDECILLDEYSQEVYSPTIIVRPDETATKIIRLYDTDMTVQVALMSLGGKDNQYKHTVGTVSGDGTLVIPAPGRYRLEHNGSPGDVIAICEDTPCCFFPLISGYTG